MSEPDKSGGVMSVPTDGHNELGDVDVYWVSRTSPYESGVLNNDRGVKAKHFNDFHGALVAITTSQESCRTAVIEVDDFGSAASFVGILRSLRTHCPDWAIILKCSQFSNDDFSLERLPICDVSVRSFSQGEALDNILKIARNNADAWKNRLSEMYAN